MTDLLKRTIFSFVFLASVFIPPTQHSFAGTNVVSSSKIMIALKEDALTLQAKNVSSSQVLQAIENEVGFEMILQSDLQEEAEDWSFNQVPFLEAMRNIVGDNYRIAILYDEAYPQKVSKVWVFEAEIKQPDHSISTQLDPDSPFAEERATLGNFASESLEDPDHSLDQNRAFLKKLGDIDPDIRLQVVNTLGENSAEWVIPVLGQVLFSDSDSEVRLAAVEALKNRDSEAATEFLKVALQDENKRVRQVAMKNLR